MSVHKPNPRYGWHGQPEGELATPVTIEPAYRNSNDEAPSRYRLYGDDGSDFMRWYHENRGGAGGGTRKRDPSTVPSHEVVAQHRAYVETWIRDIRNHRAWAHPEMPRTVTRVTPDGNRLKVVAPPRDSVRISIRYSETLEKLDDDLKLRAQLMNDAALFM